MLFTKTLTPSIIAKIKPPKTALLRAAFAPPLHAKTPPVTKPAVIAFQGSSLPRYRSNAQSNTLNKPAQTAKFPKIIFKSHQNNYKFSVLVIIPPNTGALLLKPAKALFRRSPEGAFFALLTK